MGVGFILGIVVFVVVLIVVLRVLAYFNSSLRKLSKSNERAVRRHVDADTERRRSSMRIVR